MAAEQRRDFQGALLEATGSAASARSRAGRRRALGTGVAEQFIGGGGADRIYGRGGDDYVALLGREFVIGG
jgi:hypothetical protein